MPSARLLLRPDRLRTSTYCFWRPRLRRTGLTSERPAPPPGHSLQRFEQCWNNGLHTECAFLHTNTRFSGSTIAALSTAHDDTPHTPPPYPAPQGLYCTLVSDFPPALSARPRPSQIHAPIRRRRPRRRLPDRARGPHSVELVLLHALAAHLEVGRREGGLLRRAQPVLVS